MVFLLEQLKEKNHCIYPHTHVKEEGFAIYSTQRLWFSLLCACDVVESVRDAGLVWLRVLDLPTDESYDFKWTK